MANFAIKGHPTRGRDVIEILEMLGGLNVNNYKGTESSWYYIITNNYIDWCHECTPESNFFSFTLEDFLEKFPYKVGDKVLILANTNYVYTIKSMTWDIDQVKYKIKAIDDIENEFYWLADELLYYTEQKEETMEEKRIDIPKGYEFAGVDDDAQQVVFTPIQPEYPKTFIECCDILYPNENFQTVSQPIKGHNGKKLFILQKLLICRDAYWKIAGEQMGLGKPWEPYWTIYKQKFCLGTDKDKVIEECVTTGNRILTFPTKEMRDAFYENFKELIEECKEFL